ncbi:MAG TPA: SDR family NAD(P)-dependent oxidoreductase, partial [Tepidisphaeraceae bacterium]|nr:SDR family NAD(P)-dependent oxidoreductase [Tepidisphaeraceae bacterium]
MQFPNQTILVAGGTGGLGRAVSLAFLQEGANVAVTYRKPEEFAALQSAAAANSSRLEGHITDVTDESAVSQLIEKILSKHGRLDALVNTVGGFTGGQKFWEADGKSLDQMLTVNLRSGWVLSRAAVRPMLKAGRGSIINIAS